jgi:hypothetical protein
MRSGNLRRCFGIEKVERHDVEPALAETRARSSPERMQLRRAGAGREDERCGSRVLVLRRIEQSRGGLTRGNIERDLLHVLHPL